LIDVDRSTLRLSTGYPIDTYLIKKTAPGKAVSYARICLNAQLHIKKSMLTVKLSFFIWMVIAPI
jgi:hypothetical protein